MKYLIILVCTIIFFALNGCSDELVTNSALEWVVGDTTASEVTKEINTGLNSELEFRAENSSLCATYGVHVIINKGDNELFNEYINTFPSTLKISIPLNTIIKIKTEITPLENQPLIICKRLGDVRCVINF